MRTIYSSQEDLMKSAAQEANELQLVTFATMVKNGFKVVKIIYQGDRCAINMAAGTTSGWLTPDGKFHRPAKGKKHVSINTRTLERIW